METDFLVRLSHDLGLQPCSVVPPEGLLSPPPAEQGRVLFGERGQSCGIWQATPYAETLIDYPLNEMACVAAGEIAITPEGGERLIFTAGDSYLMRKGFTGRFEVLAQCRKFYFTAE